MDEREYRRRQEARRRIVNQRRGEMQNRRAFGIFAFIVGLLAIAILIVGLYILCFVREIQVENIQYSTQEEILDWIQEDTTIANSVITYVKYNFLENELPGKVKDVEIALNTPWSITVLVTEKVPIGGIELEEMYIYCDENGTVILESQEPIEGITLIENIIVEEYTLYETLEIESVEIFENVLEVITTLNENELIIDNISCNGGAEVNITIGGIEILLGEDNYQEKIAQIEPILANLVDEEGTLDLVMYSSSDDIISFVRKNSENSQNSID